MTTPTPDKADFKDLKSRRAEWLRWFSGEDRHSIMRQIHHMIWDAAVFRVINQSRDFAEKDERGEPELNGTIHHMINRCFLVSQTTAIRRLLDRETAEGKRSVFSLYRLVTDVEKHGALLTRKNLLAVEELPFDSDRPEEEWVREALAKLKPGETATSFAGPALHQWHLSVSRHNGIDTLCNVGENDRSPDDAICPDVF